MNNIQINIKFLISRLQCVIKRNFLNELKLRAAGVGEWGKRILFGTIKKSSSFSFELNYSKLPSLFCQFRSKRVTLVSMSIKIRGLEDACTQEKITRYENEMAPHILTRLPNSDRLTLRFPIIIHLNRES